MSEPGKGRELRKYLGTMVRWIWLLVLCTALGAGGAFAASKIQPPVYRATALLIVDQNAVGQDTYSSVLASDQLVTTYVNLINQPAVLQKAAALAGGITASQLGTRLHVAAESGTQVIQVQADDPNPQRAADLANDVAAAFISVQQQTAAAEFNDANDQLNQQLNAVAAEIDSLTSQISTLRANDPTSPRIQTLQQQLTAAQARRDSLQNISGQLIVQGLTASNNLRVFQPAIPPTTPDHPKVMLNTLLGGTVGLLLAIGTALLFEFLDDRLRSPEDVETVSTLPTLATLSSGSKHGALLTAGDDSRLAESFRILRTNLSFSSLDRPLRTIVVTSAVPGEGKSTTSINLAISLAQSGKRVALIDADLRRPTVHKRLGMQNTNGLSLRLLGEMANFGLDYPLATLAAYPNLHVVTAGPKPPNPTELLGSERMSQFLQALLSGGPQRPAMDLLVLDTPPTVAFADATVLAGRADGTILVADATFSREGQLLRARDALKRVNAHLLGVVLNRVAHKREEGYYYEHYHRETTGEHQAIVSPAATAGSWTGVRTGAGSLSAPASVPAATRTARESTETGW
jgi:succinoglycan biosynthesis transport protein ExoP